MVYYYCSNVDFIEEKLKEKGLKGIDGIKSVCGVIDCKDCPFHPNRINLKELF